MNVGPNNGHRLQVARSRFASMLIREAYDVTGLNFKQLDQVLGYEEGYCRRYSLFPHPCRAPQAGRLQDLEDRVARLLGRPSHTVVLESLTKVIGAPSGGMNVREFDKYSLWFTYADGWPTYDVLRDHEEPGMPIDWKYYRLEPKSKIHELVRDNVPAERWPSMLRVYAWQWGTLWSCGLPWLSKEAYGVANDVATAEFICSEVLRTAPFLAKARRGEMASSFYCDESGPIEDEFMPSDDCFDDLIGPKDEVADELSAPEICRKGTVIFANFWRRRVTKISCEIK